uniref:Uncharacterized protein n=1 Tax=Tetranychus urticae TaxID=32264 RepID=T1JXQ9_TETUR
MESLYHVSFWNEIRHQLSSLQVHCDNIHMEFLDFLEKGE